MHIGSNCAYECWYFRQMVKRMKIFLITYIITVIQQFHQLSCYVQDCEKSCVKEYFPSKVKEYSSHIFDLVSVHWHRMTCVSVGNVSLWFIPSVHSTRTVSLCAWYTFKIWYFLHFFFYIFTFYILVENTLDILQYSQKH